mmetsp:Transcript_80210/g.162393  ORF Transcript_80210/g.162393 Transcript_80210/m.162393 type:complete len:107 (-) Transcript_80210:55-375(-)
MAVRASKAIPATLLPPHIPACWATIMRMALGADRERCRPFDRFIITLGFRDTFWRRGRRRNIFLIIALAVPAPEAQVTTGAVDAVAATALTLYETARGSAAVRVAD